MARKRQTWSSVPKAVTDPNRNAEVLDGTQAMRASPDAAPRPRRPATNAQGTKRKRTASAPKSVPALVDDAGSDSPLSNIEELEPPVEEVPSKPARPKSKKASAPKGSKGAAPAPRIVDPEADEEELASAEEVKDALTRPAPVNSDYVPLPWKGRLGYACLNTYLRNSTPPVFSSRTCRIASILEHRHPLQYADQPAHPTKNRPDKTQPPSVERGQLYVQELGLANARDIVRMLRWNDKYGIKFLRLSSEMFPFASHEEYGYRLAPFASEALAGAGKVAAVLGHRLTTHPGQFTQLGSPRKQVIDNAIRDLEYHAELLSLLRLPPQQDRDAVMILHLGGVFGDKEATLDRFRVNYARLSPGIKKRLVLENDDVSWSVHDLLPICEELNIPLVLDFHHHNIIFDDTQIREGTKDIMDLFPRILQTWRRKNITPKMHYSEPTAAAVTPRQRRKHSPRVARLPPCPPDMDLMIEAKDKEQAVFELMRTYKLPGHDSFHEIAPHIRLDDNKAAMKSKRKSKKKANGDEVDEEDEGPSLVPEAEIGMGGLGGQVYWPLGKEEWLRPVKRVLTKKVEDSPEQQEDDETKEPPQKGSKMMKKTSSTAAKKYAIEKRGEVLSDATKKDAAKKQPAKKDVVKRAPAAKHERDDREVEPNVKEDGPAKEKQATCRPKRRA